MRNKGTVTLFASSILLITGCQGNSVSGYFSTIPSSNSTSSTTSLAGGTIGPSSPGVTVSPAPGPSMKPTPTPSVTATATPTPTPSPSPSGAVVCSSLGGSTTGSTATSGLQGTLSYIPTNTAENMNSIDLASFATSGITVTNNVFFSQVDVPSQSFTDGFPAENGQPLTDNSGNVLNQYFSLNFNSQIVLGPNDAPGNYQFLTLSDDGSIFSIDSSSGVMTPIIREDGEHATMVGCSASTVAMKAGVPVKMNLQYFQGPKVTIAMVLMWRLVPAGGSLNPPECTNNSSNPGGDNYYFNENVTPSAPLAPYEAIVNDGWHVLGPQNFVLPSTTATNPCVTGN